MTNRLWTRAIAALFCIACVLPAAACGQSATSVSNSPASTNLPVATLPQSGELAPGSYRLVDGDTVDVRSDWLTLTLPAGWTAKEGYLVNKNGDQPPHGMAISAWEITKVYEDPCHSATTPATTIGPTVDDLVAALAGQKRGVTATAVDAMIGGFRGKRIDLVVPPSVVPALCEGGRYLSWLDRVGGQRYNQAAGQHDELYIMDVVGHRLVINTAFYSASDQAEVTAIVATARITP